MRQTNRVFAFVAGLLACVAVHSRGAAVTLSIAVDGNDANDGQTAPVKTLARAVALASEGDIIEFGDGEFEEPAVQVRIDKNIIVTSKNGPDHTTFRSLHQGVVGDVTDHSGWLYLTNCPNAVVSGLYFCGRWPDNSQPQIRTAIYMTETAGTVSNCVFRYLKGGVRRGDTTYTTGNVYGMGPAVFMYGGTVVDSLFEENCANRFYPKGGAISMGNLGCTGTPLVERCTFNRNWCASLPSNNSSQGGAIWIAGGATLRNCLFNGNHSDRGMLGAVGYAWYAGSFKIVNCTAVSNACSTANQTSERTWPTSSKQLFVSLAWGNYSAGIVEDTADPGFVDAANGDFHLAAGSTAIDASTGSVSDKGTFDLDGKPRVMGAKADKGCYEFDPNLFSLGIDCWNLGTFAPAEVRFRATAIGGEMDDSKSFWTFDGTEPSSANHAAVGTNVTVTLQSGQYRVRFVTEANGRAYYVDKPNMISLLGSHVYVRKDNTTAAFPYDNWERAAADFSDAMAIAVANQVVTVDDGVYQVRSALVVPAGLAIRSVNGPGKTVLDASSCGYPAVRLSSAGCTLEGLTIRNALNTVTYDPAGILMTADCVVTNCVLDTCSSLGNNSSALSLSAGLAVDCLFTNCSMKTGTSGIAIGITQNGLIDRCRVYDSRFYGATYANEECDGAIRVTGGTVRNTLVTGTRNGGCPGIYVGTNGKVENCTVVSNVSLKASTDAFGCYVAAASGAVTNTIAALNVDADGVAANAGGNEPSFGYCAVPGGYGANSVAASPRFRNSANRDFRLLASSPGVNAATVLPWMEGSIDLDGRRRMFANPDIGCYECPLFGLTIILK